MIGIGAKIATLNYISLHILAYFSISKKTTKKKKGASFEVPWIRGSEGEKYLPPPRKIDRLADG